MNETPTPGITFRETMTGGFRLGSSDPAEGRRQGEAARTALTLHATVTIRDVRRFIDERDHPGGLTGTVDFEPLGAGLPVTRGRFNHFTPEDHPDLQRTTYEVAFAAHGTPYVLALRREVRDAPDADRRADLMTLRATLHEGTDASGPIVGAGILALGPDGLARLASSMRVTDAPSLGERALTLTAFGRFFLGDQWDTYATPPSGLRGAWRRLTGRLRGRR